MVVDYGRGNQGRIRARGRRTSGVGGWPNRYPPGSPALCCHRLPSSMPSFDACSKPKCNQTPGGTHTSGVTVPRSHTTHLTHVLMSRLHPQVRRRARSKELALRNQSEPTSEE